MPALASYEFASPLSGYEGLPPLPDEKNADGKSYANPPAARSAAYEAFATPISNDARGGFDVHIYYFPSSPVQTQYARELHERIRREFPELRIYRLWDRPIGPHGVAMFEVNIFSPDQFGAFVPWLVVHRGPLSALVHPNTEDEERDHTHGATWLGERMPLDLGGFRRIKEMKAKEERQNGGI